MKLRFWKKNVPVQLRDDVVVKRITELVQPAKPKVKRGQGRPIGSGQWGKFAADLATHGEWREIPRSKDGSRSYAIKYLKSYGCEVKRVRLPNGTYECWARLKGQPDFTRPDPKRRKAAA